jgi:hypothetical protein
MASWRTEAGPLSRGEAELPQDWAGHGTVVEPRLQIDSRQSDPGLLR